MPLCLCVSKKPPRPRNIWKHRDTEFTEINLFGLRPNHSPAPPIHPLPIHPPPIRSPSIRPPLSVPLCLCVSKNPQDRATFGNTETQSSRRYISSAYGQTLPPPHLSIPHLSVPFFPSPSLCASVPLCFKKTPVFPKPQGPDIRKVTKRELLAESVIFATALIFPFPAVNPTGAVMTIGSNFDSFGPSSGCTSLQ